jgi:hypothetical protein
VNALAKPDVGKYLNDHFASAYQKVATFKIVNGQKQGGNVASYFCTPDGQVLHAVAGPVDGPTLLREARWVVETRKMADLESKDEKGLKEFFRKAHADRLAQEGGVRSKLTPRSEITSEDVAAVLDRGRGLSNDARIHLLLSVYPLAPIGKVYRPIFERVLNEQVSTSPVQEGDVARAGPARTLEPTAEDEREAKRMEQVFRARNDPPLMEVYSGKSLNDLLTDLRRLDDRGVAGPEVVLDDGDVRRLNVTAAGHGDVGPAALLQDPLAWPPLLRGDDFAEARAQVEAGLTAAKKQAARGPVDRGVLMALLAALDQTDKRLTAVIRAKGLQAGWTATDAIEAGAFLARLKEAAPVLQQPDVGRYLDGTYAARGKNVRELVRQMADKGLRFAPAAPADEPAYRAVQRALASYDAKAHAAAE